MAEEQNEDHQHHFASLASVQEAARRPLLPGEVDLFDAWSLYYRGRFGDCIRTLVTSIELVVESQLKAALKDKGFQAAAIEEKLKETWNDFDSRLDEYCRLTGRRVPGPLLSWIHYINGTRLELELSRTRKLRHKIVHRGLRLEPSLEKPMLRAVETMTWLFDWFYKRRDIGFTDPGPKGKYGVKSQLRGYLLRFDSEICASGVRVVWEKPNFDDIPFSDDLIEDQLVQSIDKDMPDIELFAKMSLERLNFEFVADAPKPEIDGPLAIERFVVKYQEEFIPVFLSSVHTLIDEGEVEKVAAALQARTVAGIPVKHAILLVNHQCGLDLAVRHGIPCTPLAGIAAKSCGVSIISTIDLLRLVRGITVLSWNSVAVTESLLQFGVSGRVPPQCRLLGSVRRIFDRPGVMSLELNEKSEVKIGEKLVVRLGTIFHEQTIDSMQVDGNSVESCIGATVGIKTSLKSREVPRGAEVFVTVPYS